MALENYLFAILAGGVTILVLSRGLNKLNILFAITPLIATVNSLLLVAYEETGNEIVYGISWLSFLVIPVGVVLTVFYIHIGEHFLTDKKVIIPSILYLTISVIFSVYASLNAPLSGLPKGLGFIIVLFPTIIVVVGYYLLIPVMPDRKITLIIFVLGASIRALAFIIEILFLIILSSEFLILKPLLVIGVLLIFISFTSLTRRLEEKIISS